MRDAIRNSFAELSPGHQKVARFILDRPNDVVTSSMRTVAERAGTIPSTLVRFAQHMGYGGWPALKQALVEEMGLAPQQYGERAKSLVGRAADETLVGEMFNVHRFNLQATERKNDAAFARASRMLEKAPTVHVAGFRACFPVAFSFVYIYRLLRQSVLLVDGNGGSLEMQLRGVQPKDAVVVISFVPYSREALQACKAARAAGASVIAITDSSASPISLMADETLLFTIDSPSFFPSILAAVAVAEALLLLLASRAGKSGVKRIHRSGSELFATGAYLPPPRAAGRR